jgi:hypothetical protein
MAGFTCNFNSYYLICMRTMVERDRNLLRETREEIAGKIDQLLDEHAKTGCPCLDRSNQQVKALRDIWPKVTNG